MALEPLAGQGSTMSQPVADRAQAGAFGERSICHQGHKHHTRKTREQENKVGEGRRTLLRILGGRVQAGALRKEIDLVPRRQNWARDSITSPSSRQGRWDLPPQCPWILLRKLPVRSRMSTCTAPARTQEATQTKATTRLVATANVCHQSFFFQSRLCLPPAMSRILLRKLPFQSRMSTSQPQPASKNLTCDLTVT